MPEECCQLVGDLDLGIEGCIISINTSCNTEWSMACGDTQPLEGPSTGTVNITAYADTQLWIGCPSKAGVSIPFVRKYDCEEDITYFIFNGQGQSYYTGEADQYVRLIHELGYTCEAISASSASGPTSIYTRSRQVNGYGMEYTGQPIPFITSAEGTAIVLGGILGDTTYYLQSFSLDLNPGQFPTASYSFVHAIQTS
jgi:hypothetical protein